MPPSPRPASSIRMGHDSVASLIHQTVAQMLGRPSPTIYSGTSLNIAFADPACQALISEPADAVAFQSAVTSVLGFALPAEPNHVAGATARALWMAPGQWLIVSDDRADIGLTARLEEASRACGGFVSDVTDGFAVFELSGSAVLNLLTMGCALDFDNAAMTSGRSARTLFAGMPVVLYCWGGAGRYRIHAERQFAQHLCEWLQTAASAVP